VGCDACAERFGLLWSLDESDPGSSALRLSMPCFISPRALKRPCPRRASHRDGDRGDSPGCRPAAMPRAPSIGCPVSSGETFPISPGTPLICPWKLWIRCGRALVRVARTAMRSGSRFRGGRVTSDAHTKVLPFEEQAGCVPSTCVGMRERAVSNALRFVAIRVTRKRPRTTFLFS